LGRWADENRDWSLHLLPEGEAYPSYRLLPALRLACLTDDELGADERGKESKRLGIWRRQVAGLEAWEEGTVEGESAWEKRARELLVEMCEWAAAEAKAGRLSAEAVRDRLEDGMGERGRAYGVRCVLELWREAEEVSEKVGALARSGGVLW
jgi:hypothetical protein